MINTGILMIKSIAQSPWFSLLTILGMLIFAMGFAMTLISTLKAQWNHKTGEARFIISGISAIVIGFLIIGLTSVIA